MKGVISAPQPEAVEAGADVLRDAGNAVDAAVACALVQTAVGPLMCGVAGFGTMHVWLPGHDIHRILDFHGRAPRAVRADMWADLVRGEAEDGFGFLLEGAVNEIGYQSITTPMTLRALDDALARFGSRDLADLLEPAIAWCEDGFQVRPHVSAYWNERPSSGRVAHIDYLTLMAHTPSGPATERLRVGGAARRRCRAWGMTCTFRVEATKSPRSRFESGMETVLGEG